MHICVMALFSGLLYASEQTAVNVHVHQDRKTAEGSFIVTIVLTQRER